MDNEKQVEEHLKLKITTEEDLAILSVLLQDAIYKRSMCSYHAQHQKCFRMLFNRFCWERAIDENDLFRSHLGLYIHNVENIYVSKEIENDDYGYLNLLSCQYFDHNLYFLFSNNKKIKIQVSDLLIYAKDLHNHWPTHMQPYHNIG